MPSRKNPALMTLLVSAATCLSGYALHAFAEGGPTTQPLWYSGSVADDAGAPLDGNHQVWVRMYAQLSGAGAAVCASGPVMLPFDNGRFRVEMSAACVEAIKSNPDLFVELSVDDDKSPFPRSKVGAVPYALEANHAATASQAVGPLKQAVDAIPTITEWQGFDPTVYVNDQLLSGTSSLTSGRYRRVGDTVEAQVSIVSSVITGDGTVAFGLPNTLLPDPSKLVPWAQVGQGHLTSNTNQNWLANVQVDDAKQRLQLRVDSPDQPGGTVTTSFPVALRTGGELQFTFAVPVSGWTTRAL